MATHNPSVKFTFEQLEEIEYIVAAYMGGRVGQYIHDYSDFQDWLEHHKSVIRFGIGRDPNACETCEGDPANTPGGCRCKGCGIVGTQPWGG